MCFIPILIYSCSQPGRRWKHAPSEPFSQLSSVGGGEAGLAAHCEKTFEESLNPTWNEDGMNMGWTTSWAHSRDRTRLSRCADHVTHITRIHKYMISYSVYIDIIGFIGEGHRGSTGTGDFLNFTLRGLIKIYSNPKLAVLASHWHDIGIIGSEFAQDALNLLFLGDTNRVVAVLTSASNERNLLLFV